MIAANAGLNRPNLNLDCAQPWRTRGLWRLEVKLQRFLQVSKGLLFGLTLAGDIDFEALRDVPIPFPPDGGGEWSLHDHILSYRRQVRAPREEGRNKLLVS